MALHDGEIAAQSGGREQGTTFTVTLPLRQTHVSQHSPPRLGSLSDAPLPPADKVLAIAVCADVLGRGRGRGVSARPG